MAAAVVEVSGVRAASAIAAREPLAAVVWSMESTVAAAVMAAAAAAAAAAVAAEASWL